MKTNFYRFIAIAIITMAFIALSMTGCGSNDPEPQHTHDWQWVETTAPTCETAGVETETCTMCGATRGTRPVSALGHDWGDWEQTKAPTTTEDGEETRTCKHDPTHKETRPIEKLGEPAQRQFTIADLDFLSSADPKIYYTIAIKDERTNCGSATLEQITIKVGDEDKNIVEYLESAIMGAFTAGNAPMRARFRNVFGVANGVTIIVDNPATPYKLKSTDKNAIYIHINYLQDNPTDIQQNITDVVTAMNSNGAGLPIVIE